MRYYHTENGYIATVGVLDGEEITEEEFSLNYNAMLERQAAEAVYSATPDEIAAALEEIL